MRITKPATRSNIHVGMKISKEVIFNPFNIKIVNNMSPMMIPVKIKKS